MFKDLDVYKIILLASVVLIPGAWGYAYYMDGQVDEAKRSLLLATNGRTSQVDQIGELIAQLETVQENAALGQETDAKLFFQGQLINSDKSRSIDPNSFQIIEDDSGPGRGRRSASKHRDIEVDLKFVEKDYRLTRSYLHALLLNCESQGLRIWKLRRLSIENAALKELKKTDTPPKTVPDEWLLRNLTFARRVPSN